jgi:hypothetical protein
MFAFTATVGGGAKLQHMRKTEAAGVAVSGSPHLPGSAVQI